MDFLTSLSFIKGNILLSALLDGTFTRISKGCHEIADPKLSPCHLNCKRYFSGGPRQPRHRVDLRSAVFESAGVTHMFRRTVDCAVGYGSHSGKEIPSNPGIFDSSVGSGDRIHPDRLPTKTIRKKNRVGSRSGGDQCESAANRAIEQKRSTMSRQPSQDALRH
jgi:hypothetical protein